MPEVPRPKGKAICRREPRWSDCVIISIALDGSGKNRYANHSPHVFAGLLPNLWGAFRRFAWKICHIFLIHISLWIHLSCKRFARDKTLRTRKTSFPISATCGAAVFGMTQCCRNHNWDWFYLCQCCSPTTQIWGSTNLPADRMPC
jgi:hypothetical protein